MIDEKKIYEAANKFAEKCSGDYIATSNAIEGFKAGINWFLDNLWHDSSECDNNNLNDRVLLLAEDTQKNMSIVTGYDVKTSKPFYTKFLYLKDLLKGIE